MHSVHILVGLPTPEMVHSSFAFGNLPDLIAHTRAVIPDVKITMAHRVGVRTDANRNAILKQAIEDGTVDYILWLDVDEEYPVDILERFLLDPKKLGIDVDVIGSLYFKRNHPYQPVAYQYSGENLKRYKSVLASAISPNQIYEVDGLGYGGMLVNMKVYQRLGQKRWTNYGTNFHLPFDCYNHETHDLVFCHDVKEAGMSLKLHGGVRPGHLSTIAVGIEDWRKATAETFNFESLPPNVAVIMPTTDIKQAQLAGEVMRKRAGADCIIQVVHDDIGSGYVASLNAAAMEIDADFIVYTAQDALVGQNWLKEALLRMLTTNAGLVGFNDGKWNGHLASFGLVDRKWVTSLYGGFIFNPVYHSHYADTELTQIAKAQGRYAYAEKAVMLEVDYDKSLGRGKGVNKEDKRLYRQRVSSQFDKLVTNDAILKEFS